MMIKSIQKKVVLVVFAFITCYMLFLFIMNNLFLEEYYIKSLEKTFVSEANEIAQVLREDPGDLLPLLKNKNNRFGFKYVVANRKGNVDYSSVPEFDPKMDLRLEVGHINFINDELKGTDDYQYMIIKNNDPRKDQVLIAKNVADKKVLIITEQLYDIRVNVNMAIQFFMIVGIVGLFVILTITYIISYKLVKPIVNLNEQAKSISRLEFIENNDANRSDEFGDLARSMNHIGSELENRIRQLNNMNTDLNDDMVNQRKFLASIAHEFKSPIGIIRGYSESIHKDLHSNKNERNEFLTYIVEESDRLTNLVEDIVMLAQIDERDFRLNKEEMDLGYFLDQAVLRHNRGFESKGRIELNEDLKDVRFSADPMRMNQIIDNLISNAKKYSSNKNEIIVCIKAVNGKNVVSFTNPVKNMDGIDPNILLRPFYRLEESRSRTTGGHGLGLSVVKALVEAHGWQLEMSIKSSLLTVSIEIE